MRQENFAIVVDGLDKNLRLTDGEVVETILCLAVPVLRLLWIRRSLGSNAAAATSHDAGDAHMVLGVVVRKPQLLVMAVARDQQIHAKATQGCIEVLLMSTRKVRNHNLPVRLALSHELLDPWLLLRPERGEPAGAGIHGLGSIRCSTGGRGLVVLSAAHVVVGVLLWRHGIDEVGVQEKVVYVEAEVCVHDGGLVVGRGHDPAVAGPGVGDLLIPAVVKLEAPPVMVAQNTEPRLVGEAGPLIDTFEDLVKLVLRRVRDLIHRTPTRLLNTAPVEVVTYVEDILWVDERSAGFKGIGYQKLGLIVYACHIAALWGTWSLAASIKALHELLMIAVLHVVHFVPATPGKDAGTRSTTPIVGDDGGPSLWRIEGAIHATPITDSKDVHLMSSMDDRGRPVLALVAHGSLRRNAPNALVIPVAARAKAGIQLVACEAITAGWAAASRARWQSAEGISWWGTVVQPLEIL